MSTEFARRLLGLDKKKKKKPEAPPPPPPPRYEEQEVEIYDAHSSGEYGRAARTRQQVVNRARKPSYDGKSYTGGGQHVSTHGRTAGAHTPAIAGDVKGYVDSPSSLARASEQAASPGSYETGRSRSRKESVVHPIGRTGPEVSSASAVRPLFVCRPMSVSWHLPRYFGPSRRTSGSRCSLSRQTRVWQETA